MDSSNIKDGFILQIRFVKIGLREGKKWGMGRGRGIVPKTEQVRKNGKV